NYWSWMAQLLPYVEQDNLYRQADAWAHKTPYSGLYYWPWGGFWLTPPTPPNPALGTLVPTWTCPADPRTLQASYMDPFGAGSINIAFTAYLGVNGANSGTLDGVLWF